MVLVRYILLRYHTLLKLRKYTMRDKIEKVALEIVEAIKTKKKLNLNQKKLDVDKDGKIEGSDLSKLRQDSNKANFYDRALNLLIAEHFRILETMAPVAPNKNMKDYKKRQRRLAGSAFKDSERSVGEPQGNKLSDAPSLTNRQYDLKKAMKARTGMNTGSPAGSFTRSY